MKPILLLITMLLFFSCLTQEEKAEKQFNDFVFKSDYMYRAFNDYTNVALFVKSAQEGVYDKNKLIKDYNNKIAAVLGKTNNLDTIEARIERHGDLYMKYMVSDAFYRFSRNEIESARYKKEKDSLSKLMKP